MTQSAGKPTSCEWPNAHTIPSLDKSVDTINTEEREVGIIVVGKHFLQHADIPNFAGGRRCGDPRGERAWQSMPQMSVHGLQSLW